MIARFVITFLAAGLAGLVAADAGGNRRTRNAAATAPSAPAAPRATPAAAPTASFDTFRVIGDRNIFNSTRTGRRERSEESRGPRGDTISFVGTMEYAKGLFAFFDGSDPSYRKALRMGESVGPFKLASIAANQIELQRDGKPLTLHMAQQLRRPDGGDWTLIGADVARAEAQAARAAEATKTPDPTAPPVIPADASDALRRLMEQRRKSLQQQ